jgi:hypothetical protein
LLPGDPKSKSQRVVSPGWDSKRVCKREAECLGAGRLILTNLAIRRLATFKILAAVFLSAALAPLIYPQSTPQLQVEIGTNHEIHILANDVSYGEVLRALQKKLGWEIEIPPLANELKLSSVRIETMEPSVAFAKLLEGSRLGYALLAAKSKSQIVRVFVIPLTPRETSGNQDATLRPPISDDAETRATLPLPAQAPSATPIEPAAPVADAEQLEAVPTMPLSEAINVMGVPPGVSLGDIGETNTIPISEAINVMGVPPGVSPGDIGETNTIPISEAATIMGVPPGISPGDVGKTTTSPLPTGPGMGP